MRPPPRRSWLATLLSLLSLAPAWPALPPALSACSSEPHPEPDAPTSPEQARAPNVPAVPTGPARPNGPDAPPLDGGRLEAPLAGLLAFTREGALTMVSEAGSDSARVWQTRELAPPPLDEPVDVVWDPWLARALVVSTADDETRSTLAAVTLDGGACELSVSTGRLRVLAAEGGLVSFEHGDAGPRVRFSPHQGAAPPSRACDEPSSLVAEQRDEGLFVRVASRSGEEREVHAVPSAVKLGPPERTGPTRVAGPARSPTRWSARERTIDATQGDELVRVLAGGEVASLDDALTVEPAGGGPWSLALASVWRRGEPWPRAVLVAIDPERHVQLVELPGHAVAADVLYRRALAGRSRDGRLELFVALFEGVVRVIEREHGLLSVDRGFEGGGLVGPITLATGRASITPP
jgi:hypothetical protein